MDPGILPVVGPDVDISPADVASHLVPRLEMRDRQERAGTVEGDGHGGSVHATGDRDRRG